VIKLHLMAGKGLTAQLAGELDGIRRRDPAAMLEAIRRSLEVKLSYFEGDEFDSGRRNLLNFGHCFGHALEASSDFAIPHGQASWSESFSRIWSAVRRGLMTDQTARALEDRLLLPSLVRPRLPPSRRCKDPRCPQAGQEADRSGAALDPHGRGSIHAEGRRFRCRPTRATTGELAARLGIA